MAGSDRRWNLNVHYHRVILDVAPPAGGAALDIGCGDGELCFDLADRGFTVVGLDADAPSIERARSDPRVTTAVEFICGDLFSHPFEPGSFDLVASVAMLHHVDAESGLRRMKELVRPGGAVAIVGFAKLSDPRDLALAVAGRALKAAHRRRGDHWEYKAPTVWPPPLTMKQMAAVAQDVMPGATFRRLLSSRYSLTWEAPGELLGR